VTKILIDSMGLNISIEQLEDDFELLQDIRTGKKKEVLTDSSEVF